MPSFEETIAESLKDRVKFPEEDAQAESFQEEESSLTQEKVTQPTKEESQEAPTESKKEEVKAEEPVVEETKTEPSVEDFDKAAFRKQLEEELKAEYDTKLTEATSKDPFANERVKKLNELAAAGIDIDSPDFWKWQYTNVEDFDTSTKEGGLSLKRLELEVEHPNLNDKQIDRLLKRGYPALFDESLDATDTEYQEALEDLSIDASTSVTKLKKHKESVQLPKVDLQKREQEEKAAKAASETFIKEVRESVQKYKEDPIKLSDDLEIKYQPSEDAVKFAESSMINNQTWFIDNYANENGVDFPRLQRDMGRIRDFDNIVKTVYEQGISIGREEVADTLENSSTSIQEQKKETARSMKDQIGEQLRMQIGRRR
tara:strand:+ start:132 stop:1250 length:1119 start_codon:yes stop_codon:yes gene_type:complete